MVFCLRFGGEEETAARDEREEREDPCVCATHARFSRLARTKVSR